MYNRQYFIIITMETFWLDKSWAQKNLVRLVRVAIPVVEEDEEVFSDDAYS